MQHGIRSPHTLSESPVDEIHRKFPTDWIQQVGDEELRRQELTWRSPENAQTQQGGLYLGLIRGEMQHRGVEPYNTNPDDPTHFEQLTEVIQGSAA